MIIRMGVLLMVRGMRNATLKLQWQEFYLFECEFIDIDVRIGQNRAVKEAAEERTRIYKSSIYV